MRITVRAWLFTLHVQVYVFTEVLSQSQSQFLWPQTEKESGGEAMALDLATGLCVEGFPSRWWAPGPHCFIQGLWPGPLPLYRVI